MQASAPDLALLTLALIPAVLWSTIARDVLGWLLQRRPPGLFPPLTLALTGAGAGVSASLVVMLLLRETWDPASAGWGVLFAVHDALLLSVVPLGRHLVMHWPVRATRPTARWLAVNYGLGGAAIVAFVAWDLRLPGFPFGRAPNDVVAVCTTVLGALALRDLARLAARGAWRPGGLWDARSADVAACVIGVTLLVGEQIVPRVMGQSPFDLLLAPTPSWAGAGMLAFSAAGSLALSAPFLVRNLGDLVPAFLGRAGALAAAAALLLGGRALRARAAGAGLEPLVDAAVVLALVVLLGPARAWAERAVASWLFQRDRARWDALTRVLHETVPDDGVVACCGRVLDAAVRLLRLRGAAVLLHDGVVVQRGSIALRAVPALWPRSPGELPAGMLPEARIRELPPALAAALAEAEINAVVPIASPRRHWGYGFVTTDLRGASFSYEEDIAISTFADQLARLLDAGDLVAHAVAVERSLAHAEKLAAIGETAARIAHEIRNPVTAARSLAQQMVREPASPLNAEAATVILEQLERVERQVRELLRFARREDLHAEPVDLGALVQHTLAELQARLDAAQVQVSLDIADGVVARADRERLRQVLVNLVENGAEALAAVPAPRTLAVSLAAVNGSARLRVADNGPGVPADALPRLFEPFFSCKPGGTGLGLAIVRRTVDAHGGRVRAESAAGAGAAFEVELPLGGAA